MSDLVFSRQVRLETGLRVHVISPQQRQLHLAQSMGDIPVQNGYNQIQNSHDTQVPVQSLQNPVLQNDPNSKIQNTQRIGLMPIQNTQSNLIRNTEFVHLQNVESMDRIPLRKTSTGSLVSR